MAVSPAEQTGPAPAGARPDADGPGPVPGPPGRTSSRWLRRVLLANLAGQIGIVLTGGLVRLSGSGLGCPTWPQCVPGSYTPVVDQAEGWHKDIEFGNRLLTFVVSVLAIAALAVVAREVRARRATGGGRHRGLLLLGAAPLLGVLLQGLIGGVTVLTGLHPATVAVHFLGSALLIAASTLLLAEATGAPGAGDVVKPALRWVAVAVGAVSAVVLVLGTVVTGSGPHSGDADEPTRFGFDPRTVSWLHADAVWLFVGLVVALLLGLALTDAPRRARRTATWLLGVTLAQGAVGYTQYFTDLPAALVLVHMVGAAALVVAVTTTLHATLRRSPA